MAINFEQIEAEALSLPIEDRARLAEHLIASLDAGAETEQAWAKEIERRLQMLDSDAVKSIPASEVFAEIRDRLKWHHRISSRGGVRNFHNNAQKFSDIGVTLVTL